MMTCDAIQNRLLAEANPAKPASELRAHLGGCAACQAFVAAYVAMARTVKALPVPSSELAKLAFTETLTSAGPIIRSVPGIQGGFSLAMFVSIAAKPLAATAAAVAVGLGIWAAMPGPRTTFEQPVARHELLNKVVKSNTTLATTTDPKARLTVLSAMASDLRDETLDMLRAAPEDDLNSLAGLYENVVKDGLVPQAQQLDKKSPATRQEAIQAVTDALANTHDDMTNKVATAPPQAQAALKRIAAAAQTGRAKLIRIARGEGA